MLLVVSGVACKQPPSVQTPAQTETTPTAPADVAALSVKANAGDPAAQHSLGYAYDKGQGVPQDYAQAAAWYRKASDQGDADAQNNLGNAYGLGQGVPQDYAQAAAWYRKAAEQGNSVAQYNLGSRYFKGEGVPQDYVESHKWRNLAASRASAENQKGYAETRDLMAKLMTPTQIEAAQKLASAWLAAFQKRGGK